MIDKIPEADTKRLYDNWQQASHQRFEAVARAEAAEAELAEAEDTLAIVLLATGGADISRRVRTLYDRKRTQILMTEDDRGYIHIRAVATSAVSHPEPTEEER